MTSTEPPLERPIISDLLDRSRLIGILLVFPNAASLWLTIGCAIAFTAVMVEVGAVLSPPMVLMLVIGIVGGLVCFWALVCEVIALMADTYAVGRQDEFYRLKADLPADKDNTILHWPTAPHA